jgi:hypothetical protein
MGCRYYFDNDDEMTRATVERTHEKGYRSWSRTDLSIDPVGGVIAIQQRVAFGRKKPPLIFRADEITGFDIVMAGDPLERLYAGILLCALLVGLNVSGWTSDSAGWDAGGVFLDLVAVGLAFLLASWIKAPAIRWSAPAPVSFLPSHKTMMWISQA